MNRTTKDAAISVEDLDVVRGGQLVLRGISLDVAPGTVTGLLGPSGCGKTTLMRSIVGVQRIKSGNVQALGITSGSRRLRTRVAYVTQAPSVYSDLTVRENLHYFAQILGVRKAEIDKMIETVELQENTGQLVRNLSGGQRARVSLATALLGEPELLVLDEPTVGLDPVLRASLWQTFQSLSDHGVTLLISSHVMDEAANCDHLLLMREGRILVSETPAELRAHTGADDIGEAFLRIIEESEAET